MTATTTGPSAEPTASIAGVNLDTYAARLPYETSAAFPPPVETQQTQRHTFILPDVHDAGKMRSIIINALSRGYQVTVGCQDFAFSTKEEMLLKLAEYINDPAKTEVKWNKKELF